MDFETIAEFLAGANIDMSDIDLSTADKEVIQWYTDRIQKGFDDNCPEAAMAYFEHAKRNVDNKATQMYISHFTTQTMLKRNREETDKEEDSSEHHRVVVTEMQNYICPHCGKELHGTQLECSTCGYSVSVQNHKLTAHDGMAMQCKLFFDKVQLLRPLWAVSPHSLFDENFSESKVIYYTGVPKKHDNTYCISSALLSKLDVTYKVIWYDGYVLDLIKPLFCAFYSSTDNVPGNKITTAACKVAVKATFEEYAFNVFCATQKGIRETDSYKSWEQVYNSLFPAQFHKRTFLHYIMTHEDIPLQFSTDYKSVAHAASFIPKDISDADCPEIPYSYRKKILEALAIGEESPMFDKLFQNIWKNWYTYVYKKTGDQNDEILKFIQERIDRDQWQGENMYSLCLNNELSLLSRV